MSSEARTILERLIEASERMSKLVAERVAMGGPLEGDAEMSQAKADLDAATENAKAYFDHVYNAV